MKQSILVLGANGFIGQRVIAGLAATRWAAPIAGVRTPSPSAVCEQRTVDAMNEQSVRAGLHGVAAVVNCVAGDAATLLGSTRSVIAAAKNSAGVRIVHLSSMSVYGGAHGLMAESSAMRADLGPYSQAKVASERALESCPRAVVLRPGCVFGPHSEQWTVRIARLLVAHRLGDLGAAGDGYCNLVHVDDVVQAVLRALEIQGFDGKVFNLSTAEPPTWNEFLIDFARALGAVPVKRIAARQLRIETSVRAPLLKAAEIFGRRIKLDIGRLPPAISPSLLRLMGQPIRLDVQAAEQKLGVHFRSLSDSLDESARWYRDTYRNARAAK